MTRRDLKVWSMRCTRGQKILAFEVVHWSLEIFVRFELTASQINPLKSVLHDEAPYFFSKIQNDNWVNKSLNSLTPTNNRKIPGSLGEGSITGKKVRVGWNWPSPDAPLLRYP